MISYKEYEKAVFDKLMSKHKINPEFTFSFRQKAVKGAETDYFIGTERSRYFGTTFWTIPVAYPGSAMDLIDVFFKYNDGEMFSYYFEFNQTKNPYNEQNKIALELIKYLKPKIKSKIGFAFESSSSNKMESFKTKSPKSEYTDINEMLTDFEKDYNLIFPIVNKALVVIKKTNKNFEGHKITNDEFNLLYEKLNKRLVKYNSISPVVITDQESNKGTFKEIIERLKQSINEDPQTKNLFNIYDINKSHVWIGDKNGLIGSLIAHYEILYTNNHYCVEVHFEGDTLEDKTQFKPVTTNLPPLLKTFKWHKAESIKYNEGIPADDKNLINELKSQLLFLEINVGNKIRRIINSDWEPTIDQYFSNKQPLNQILFGPPGTGKTYNTINKAVEITNPEFDLTQDRKLIKDEFDRLLEEGLIVFTTFHQSMSYEDFVEGIKPVEPKVEGQAINYKVLNGIFKSLCTKASNFDLLIGQEIGNYKISNVGSEMILLEKPEAETIVPIPKYLIDEMVELVRNKILTIDEIKNKTAVAKMSASTEKYIVNGYPNIFAQIVDYLLTNEKNTKKYVLIIDEINRGNVSQIFGELITLVEEDKRLGNKEALEITLPYSKEKFGVPANLYIIGTMNTADRSVEALDTALRRRFSFEEMKPLYDLGQLNYEIAGFKVSEILKKINVRIEKLIDKDHEIGHSYFILNENEEPEEKFKLSFYNSIIPLLQEYFYGDYGKIGLVLGIGFINKKEWDNDLDSFAEFEHESSNEFDDKDIFEIIDYRYEDTNYSVNIKNKHVEMNFEKAIKLLMKENIE